MSSSNLAERYAIALIEIGEERDNCEQLGRELARVAVYLVRQTCWRYSEVQSLM